MPTARPPVHGCWTVGRKECRANLHRTNKAYRPRSAGGSGSGPWIWIPWRSASAINRPISGGDGGSEIGVAWSKTNCSNPAGVIMTSIRTGWSPIALKPCEYLAARTQNRQAQRLTSHYRTQRPLSLRGHRNTRPLADGCGRARQIPPASPSARTFRRLHLSFGPSPW